MIVRASPANEIHVLSPRAYSTLVSGADSGFKERVSIVTEWVPNGKGTNPRAQFVLTMKSCVDET